MRTRNAQRELIDLARAVARPRRANPLLALYHWRWELGAAALVPTALIALDRAVGPLWSLVVVFCLVSAVIHWPAAGRYAKARLRAVLIQHRLRTAFTHARICTLDGRRPAILWTIPRADAVTVWLFCPAGLDPNLLRSHREVLAAACFATGVRVDRHERWAHLVALRIRTTHPAEN
jgi:hypothetical protein